LNTDHADGTYVIDSIESGLARCESISTGHVLHIEKALLPRGAKEGDVLITDNGAIRIDTQATAERTKNIRNMLDVLFRKS